MRELIVLLALLMFLGSAFAADSTVTPKPGTTSQKINDTDFVKFNDPKLLNSPSMCSSETPEKCTKALYKLTGANMIIYPNEL